MTNFNGDETESMKNTLTIILKLIGMMDVSYDKEIKWDNNRLYIYLQ
ncbi:MAG: hypothetical protein P0116_16300 [Candidatus Nitrosocosmicus sp.]|nr:hypothetical protein [Candidatus Nitrosocosmicus sp.]